MVDSLKETRRQNKLVQIAIEKKEVCDQGLIKFFEKEEANKQEFTAGYDLPQTSEQIRQQDYRQDIAPMIMTLSGKLKDAKLVDSRVIKFFEAFDKNQLEILDEKYRELTQQKQQNKKLLNVHALEFTEGSELEDLFLEAIDCCRSEVVRNQIDKFVSPH